MLNPNHLDLNLIAILAWIPITYWVIKLLGSAIMGDLDPLVAFIGISMAVAVAAFCGMHATHRATPFLAGGAALLAMVAPVMQGLLNKNELNRMDVESMSKAYEQLSLRPGNYSSKVRIATMLQRRGASEHAIAILEDVVKAYGAGKGSEDEKRLLRQWKALHTGRPNARILCVECGFHNPPGPVFCEKCGAPHLLAYAAGNWFSKRASKRIYGFWIACWVGVLGFPAAIFGLPTRWVPAGIGALALTAFLVVLLSWIERPQKQ